MKIFLSALLVPVLGAGLAWGTQSEKQSTAAPARPEAAQAQAAAAATDHALSYYHYSLAHLYEEMAAAYNRQDYLQKAIDNYKLAMKYDPGSTFLSGELADLYSRSGRTREALAEAEEIVQRDPGNVEARRQLGRIYLRLLGNQQGGRLQGDVLKRAIEQYEKIVQLDAKDADSRVTLGNLYRMSNDFTKSEAVLKQALALQPENEDALTTLALLYADTSQGQAAIELLEKVTAKSPNPRLFAVLGQQYEQAHSYDKAVAAFRKALEQDKDNPEYLRSLGQNLLYSDQYDEAITIYKNLVAADPQDGDSYLRLGLAYRQAGRFEEAAESLQKAATLTPDSLGVVYNQALLAEARNRNEEAITILKGLLDKISKKDPSTYTQLDKSNRALFLERLAILYRKQENSKAAEDAADQAEKTLRSMLQNKPEDREVLMTIVQMNGRARRFPAAEQALAEVEKLAQRKEEKVAVYYEWANILERQKKYDQAEAQLKKGLAADPSNAPVLNFLGYMLADRNVRLDEAKRYIEQALAQDPANGAYLDSIGWLYYRMNRLDLAEEYLLKALQKTKDATIFEHLGDVYYQGNRLRDALAEWQKALAEAQKPTAPEGDNVDVAKIQKKIETVRVRLAQQTK